MNVALADAIGEASLDGIHSFDLEHRYTFWNTAMERISGLRASDVVGRRAPEIFRFLSEGGGLELHERALRGETVTGRDRPFSVPETGRSGWFDAHYRPLRGDGGAVIGAIGIIRDITERKLSEARLAETELRFQKMANASPVLLWMAGTDSLCTFFNQTWLTFTGRKMDDEWGVGWAEGVHFEDLERCMDTYERAFSARRPFEMEYRLRRNDGEYRWILDRGAPRFEPDGSFAGYIGSCTDITERKALEVELQEKLRQRDEFLSVASHELRTPVSALRLQIDGLLRLGTRDVDLSMEERARRFQRMQDAVVKLEQLITRLLDVSRLRAGGPQLDPRPFDLAEAVRETCDRMAKTVSATGSSLDVDTEPTPGSWDRGGIDQILVNLLSNAAKYGAGKPIRVKVSGDEARACIVVQDEGIGVAEEDQKRIFQRFERAVSTRSYGGFGLGLWIASEIARASGGGIEVASRPGAGATFTVTLPR